MEINELLGNHRVTILIGKNGSGKSTILRNIDKVKELKTLYITPERGGDLSYNANVENNMNNDENWLPVNRRVNRINQFKEQSTARFRILELLVLREIESNKKIREDKSKTFDTTVSQINELLPNVNLVRSDNGFKTTDLNHVDIETKDLSSGEAEVIALAIEALVFSREENTGQNYLLLDEPDVHLHPDLQQKFIQFVDNLSKEYGFSVLIATHSTAVIGAIGNQDDVQIVPIVERDQTEFSSFLSDTVTQQLIPIFGAHPLSSQFNMSPIILLEGEDDRRVIEQLVRSSQSLIKFSPAVVGTIAEMNKWETWLDEFLPSIYDTPRAYSLRDLDDSEHPEIDDLKYVIRTKLNCYAIENLLLTSECIQEHGFDSNEEYVAVLGCWCDANENHPYFEETTELINNFGDRREINIKNLRNILVAQLGSNKPWEVIIGQLLAKLVVSGGIQPSKEPNSVANFLGEKVLAQILSPNPD